MSTRSSNPITAYFTSAWEEFRKVTWPTREQAALLTGIVVSVSLVLGLAIGLLDLGLSQGYQLLLNKLPQATETPATSVGGTATTSDGQSIPIEVGTSPEENTSTDSSQTPSQ